ncbi:hypothetical protein ACFOOJ_10395 [Sphingobium xenophagum]|uniref:hypothetical protein n=1 Tax=Sphingobium xenophagum TaxID=121428 RepID=UPI001FD2E04B|nr:hypothetical protein [Sphingobium xenophagum]
MTEHTSPIRPARAAIAAVLALSATPLLAQEIAPPPVAPTVTVPATPSAPAVAPVAAAPATPTFAPSAPVVQATPSVEERRAAAIAAAEAEAAATPAPRRAAPRSVERAAAPVAPAAMAQSAAQSTPAVASPTVTPAPAAPIVAPEPMAQAPAEPVVAEQPARTDNALLFAMGGVALLLAGLGGAALMRRRRPADAVVDDQAVAPAPMAQPMPVAATMPVEAAPEPVRPAPVAPRTAYTPAASATDEERTIAAMVAAPPSAENPFLTHAKRLRRARFLLAERQAIETPPAPRAADPVAAPAPAVDRSQTVYRFGNDGVRTGLLKPRTS